MSTNDNSLAANDTSGNDASAAIFQMSSEEFGTFTQMLISKVKDRPKYVLQRLVKEIEELKSNHDDSNSSKKEIDYQQKLLQVFERYTFLETLYKEEHAQLLCATDNNVKLQAELQDQKAKLEEAEKRIKELEASQSADTDISATASQKIAQLEGQLVQQKEEHMRLLTRQGQGRKLLEDEVVNKDIMLNSLQQKVKEYELQIAQLKSNCENYTIIFNHIHQQNPQLMSQYFQAARVQQNQQ